jgi:chromosome segregation ATPase
MKPKPHVASDVADAPPPALLELLSAKDDIGALKSRAFSELRKFSRSLIGLALLNDDLEKCADLDAMLQGLRSEHGRLVAERDKLTASVSDLRANAERLAGENAALTQQVADLDERVAELDRQRRQLEPTVQSYNATAAAIEASQKRLAELQAEEARLKPIVQQYRDIEQKLPGEKQRLAATQEQLRRIREAI